MQTIKGRTITAGQKVKVYYNLHKKTFSVMDYTTKLVIGYSDIIQLENVTFTVQEAGRQRVIREQKKNVHAFVVGYYVNDQEGTEKRSAYYNPYKVSTFIDEAQQPLKEAKTVTCINRQIKY